MAAGLQFWSTHTNDFKCVWFKGCIFQQIWREKCNSLALGLRKNTSYRSQHITYLTRMLLDCLLSHRFDEALECLVGLCGVCRRIPELFWRTGSEVLKNCPGSYMHMIQLLKNMFVICVPFKTELLLDFTMYLVKCNNDITEAQELLTSKLSQKPFMSSPILQAYAGLFAYLEWKKCKHQFDKRYLEADDDGDMDLTGGDNRTDRDLKRQMDFHGKKALVFFVNLVEHCGVWDIFITRQVEMLQYYDMTEEAKRILVRYKEKNPENPNSHRYLYYFLKSECASKEELCSVLEDLLNVDPTSELSEEYVKLAEHKKDQLNGIIDILGALFVKLDHAACQYCVTTWKKLAAVLTQFCAAHDTRELKIFWDERADWWPQFHFRLSLVSNKDHVSELEWQLTRHKAEAAKWLLGQGNPFTQAVRNQEPQYSEVESSLSHSETGSPGIRKTANDKRCSPRKRKCNDDSSYKYKRRILCG